MLKIKPIALLVLVAFTGMLPRAIAQAMVDLGSASNFAVLAGSGITFAGAATLTGDIGTFPTATIVGIGNVTFLSGSNHAADAFTQAAKTDLAAAYADAAGRTVTATVGSELGATTLTPGVYNSAAGTFGITAGNLTLDGSGVYIFKMATTLDLAASRQVLLINGAQSGNVFWQVGSTATFLTSSVFVGSVMANTTISVGVGTSVDGRLLAQTGAVSLGGGNLVAIPEPAAFLWLAPLGAMGFVLWRRRRSVPASIVA